MGKTIRFFEKLPTKLKTRKIALNLEFWNKIYFVGNPSFNTTFYTSKVLLTSAALPHNNYSFVQQDLLTQIVMWITIVQLCY